jgi:hypothetical protein
VIEASSAVAPERPRVRGSRDSYTWYGTETRTVSRRFRSFNRNAVADWLWNAPCHQCSVTICGITTLM